MRSSLPNLPELFEALGVHGIRYVLAGSVAAQAHGVSAIEPGDLDITPACDRETLGRLACVLKALQARPEPTPGHWSTGPDGERKWVCEEPTPEHLARLEQWFPNPDDPTSFDHLFFTRLGNLDVVPEIAGTYEVLRRRAVAAEFAGCEVFVAHVDDLLAALTVPRRVKDVPRVRRLREIQRGADDQWPTSPIRS